MTDLGTIRAEIHDWLETLYFEEEGRGGYRMGPRGRVNLLSTTDAAWIRYAMNDLGGLDAARRRAWTGWIQDQQDRGDGHYAYTEAVGDGNMHSNGHAIWHAARALCVLGSEIAVFPAYLRPATSVEGLRRWFRQWEAQPQRTHHDVLALALILANGADTAWVEAYYGEIAGQQDPQTGTWPRGGDGPSISRTFAYSALFRAGGRLPPQPGKVVDAMLALQSPDGFWHDGNHSYFSTMDAIYILARLASLIGHRESDAKRALEKAREAVTALYAASKSEVMENTHGMLAIVHSLGLLAEAFPGEFRSREPWRFDWDKPQLFASRLVRESLGR